MARNKFDGVLQTMVDLKDESFVNVDDEPASPPTLSRGMSPRKMVVKVGRRKRRREDDKVDTSGAHHTYVMKLFDRSVDLAQFDEDAPLYPICRAWMRNQPLHRDNTAREDARLSGESSDDEWDENAFMDDDTPRDISKLPPPLPLDPYQPRAPPPVKSEQVLDLYQSSEAEGNQPEELLLGHMHRWKETRNRWREHSREDEGRYAHSLNILRTMYERQMKDN